MGKKLLPIILGLALVFGSVGMAFADEDAAPISAPAASFADMPDNWSTAALNKAVDNKLLSGYDEGGKKLIKADNSLTRAEMAAVVNRAFASAKSADISKATDVASWAWYHKDMAKAVKMGTFALDTKMRPGDKITRQEAFAVLARAFKLASDDASNKALDKFSDKGDIAAWALSDLNGMAAAGYIQGNAGKLNPKANITRAEFAVVMDNLVKEYIDEAGTVKSVADGNVMVRVAGVTLENVKVKGDLIVADGVGEGDLILDGVKVDGRLVARGGGANSIIIKGSSNIGKVILAKVDGAVRVVVEGGATVELIYIDDGSDDVIIKGNVGTVEVDGSGVDVTVAEGSNIKSLVVDGGNTTLNVAKGATVQKVAVNAAGAKVQGEGNVPLVQVAEGVKTPVVATPGTKVEEYKEPSTSGGGGGGTTTKHLTIDGKNIDDFAAFNLSTQLVELVDKIVADKLFTDNVDKFDNLEYSEVEAFVDTVFMSLKFRSADDFDLGVALKEVATAITSDTYKNNHVAVANQAKVISKALAAYGVSYSDGDRDKTLKTVTVKVGKTSYVVYTTDEVVVLGDFAALYNSLKGKTLVDIANAGFEITIDADDNTSRTIKLEYN